jgi:hypothetical protein
MRPRVQTPVWQNINKIDHVLRYKGSLKNAKNLKVSLSILSYHSGIKLETNANRTYRKYSNTWGLSNI